MILLRLPGLQLRAACQSISLAVAIAWVVGFCLNWTLAYWSLMIAKAAFGDRGSVLWVADGMFVTVPAIIASSCCLAYYDRIYIGRVVLSDYPRCRHCGYILTGLTAPRCPECGTVFQMPSSLYHLDGNVAEDNHCVAPFRVCRSGRLLRGGAGLTMAGVVAFSLGASPLHDWFWMLFRVRGDSLACHALLGLEAALATAVAAVVALAIYQWLPVRLHPDTQEGTADRRTSEG